MFLSPSLEALCRGLLLPWLPYTLIHGAFRGAGPAGRTSGYSRQQIPAISHRSPISSSQYRRLHRGTTKREMYSSGCSGNKSLGCRPIPVTSARICTRVTCCVDYGASRAGPSRERQPCESPGAHRDGFRLGSRTRGAESPQTQPQILSSQCLPRMSPKCAAGPASALRTLARRSLFRPCSATMETAMLHSLSC